MQLSALAYAARLASSAVVAILAPIFKEAPSGSVVSRAGQLGVLGVDGTKKIVVWWPVEYHARSVWPEIVTYVLGRKLRLPSLIESVVSGRQKQVTPIVALNGNFFPQKKESLFSIGVTNCQPEICKVLFWAFSTLRHYLKF